jgi:hypothetical protein
VRSLNSAVRRLALRHLQLRPRALCVSWSASRWFLNSMRVARGAPTHIAGLPVGKLLPPTEETFRPHCRCASAAFLCRIRSSINCSTSRAAVSMFSPRPSSAPAGCLRLPWNRSAVQSSRALRRCTCGGIIVVSLLGVGASFKVFRSQGGAKEDAHCSKLLLPALGPSPNKSLQRSAQP